MCCPMPNDQAPQVYNGSSSLATISGRRRLQIVAPAETRFLKQLIVPEFTQNLGSGFSLSTTLLLKFKKCKIFLPFYIK